VVIVRFKRLEEILIPDHYHPHIVIDPHDQKKVGTTKGCSITETYLGIAFARELNHIELSGPVIPEAAIRFGDIHDRWDG
jgi:hypothetical protein